MALPPSDGNAGFGTILQETQIPGILWRSVYKFLSCGGISKLISRSNGPKEFESVLVLFSARQHVNYFFVCKKADYENRIDSLSRLRKLNGEGYLLFCTGWISMRLNCLKVLPPATPKPGTCKRKISKKSNEGAMVFSEHCCCCFFQSENS